MNEVFISHARKDEAFVEKLAEALRKVGRDPWVDQEDIPPADDWRASIEAGIEGADNFVFVISPESAKPDCSCREEIKHAEKHHKRIIPIVYRKVPSKDLPRILRDLNWIYFRDSDDFDTAFKALIKALDTDLEWVKAHTRLTRRAVEWKKKKEDQSFLLRGVELDEAMQHLSQPKRLPKATDLQLEYIAASRKAEAERADEQARVNKKLRRRALYLTVALVSMLVLICVAGLTFSFWLDTLTGAEKITEAIVKNGSAQANGQMCRVGAIYDLADEVLEACHQAIELEPDNIWHYENRALAVMLGSEDSKAQALDDLRTAIGLAEEQDQYQDKIDDWQSWIEWVEDGNDPIDFEPDIQEQFQAELE